MRITQETPGFAPVTIVLETVGEVAKIAAILGATNDEQAESEALSVYGAKVGRAASASGNLSFRIFDKLDDIVQESKCLLS